MKKIFLLSFIFIAFITGCDSGKEKKDHFSEIAGDSIQQDTIAKEQVERANNIIRSIPQPVEMAALIKKTGAKYNNQILNDPDKVSDYNTNFRRSFNLGVYGADLGYINLYNQKQDALNYLKTVTLLAEQLKLGDFFNSAKLKELARKSGNLDSMVSITTRNFEKINIRLQQQNRSELSMYMLVGGWLEALYIATNIARENNNKELMNRIGEQKVVLSQLLSLLSFYENNKNAITLHDDLIKLKKVFDKIDIHTTYRKPTAEAKNDVMNVEDRSETKISINKEHIDAILNVVQSIRKEIIS